MKFERTPTVTDRLIEAEAEEQALARERALAERMKREERLSDLVLRARADTPVESYKLFRLEQPKRLWGFIPVEPSATIACFVEHRLCACHNIRKPHGMRCVGFTERGEMVFAKCHGYPPAYYWPISALSEKNLEQALRWFISKPAPSPH